MQSNAVHKELENLEERLNFLKTMNSSLVAQVNKKRDQADYLTIKEKALEVLKELNQVLVDSSSAT